MSRKVAEPPKSRPLSTPNAAYVSSNSSYRTVPKPATNVNSTIHKNSRPISTPIVTMLEPASKLDSKNTDTSLLPNPKIDDSLPTREISSEILGEIQDSIKQISKSRMLVPDSKFMEQITQMSFSSLQLAIPKSIEYISKLANLYDSPSLPASSLKSLLKTENLPFDSLAMPKIWTLLSVSTLLLSLPAFFLLFLVTLILSVVQNPQPNKLVCPNLEVIVWDR